MSANCDAGKEKADPFETIGCPDNNGEQSSAVSAARSPITICAPSSPHSPWPRFLHSLVVCCRYCCLHSPWRSQFAHTAQDAAPFAQLLRCCALQLLHFGMLSPLSGSDDFLPWRLLTVDPDVANTVSGQFGPCTLRR